MKETSVSVRRFKAMHGWANRILRIDLSNMRIEVQESAPYVPDYMGARGIAIKIAWDEYPEPVAPFDPANPLMIFPAALTGSRSPYSGRASVCTFGPQSYPYPWFTRSNIGGHFGGELKRAGYDGLIITGASESPVRIRICDDRVSILPADELWGQDAMDTLDALESMDGRGVRSMAIGQAGESLSKIATIQTASSSACGHGGFGAVMGSKKLKAVSVMGTGSVSLADGDRVRTIARLLRDENAAKRVTKERLERINQTLAAEGGGSVRAYACSESCVSPCNLYYQDVPGRAHDRTWSGHWTCVGTLFHGIRDEETPISRDGVFDWRLGMRGGLEMNMLTNRYGLNQWEIIIGMVPWLEACQEAGLISEVNGKPMDWRSCDFWAEFLHAMAYREGIGDVLAEGGWAAAKTLGLGEDLMRRYYTGWGYAGHWDGHADMANYIVFPFWLVPALQWLTDTRDPIPSGHGYGAQIMYKGPFSIVKTDTSPERAITWDHMRAIAQRIYGDPAAIDPHTGYKAKAFPGFYHSKRSVMKDCVPVGDTMFPLIYSENTPDRFARIGDIAGPSVEYELFKAGTGVAWSEAEFERAAERVYTLERALTVRHWARDRRMDEMVLPSFEYPESWTSPVLGERYALDRKQFEPVMDEYYALLGWDVESGWPTQARLAELGIEEVYKPMVEGARRAKTTLEGSGTEAAPQTRDEEQGS